MGIWVFGHIKWVWGLVILCFCVVWMVFQWMVWVDIYIICLYGVMVYEYLWEGNLDTGIIYLWDNTHMCDYEIGLSRWCLGLWGGRWLTWQRGLVILGWVVWDNKIGFSGCKSGLKPGNFYGMEWPWVGAFTDFRGSGYRNPVQNLA